MRTWIAVVVLAACSHSKPASQTPIPQAGVSCDQISQHLVGMMPAQDKDKADLVKTIVSVIQERCQADGWSVDARQCINEAKELRDADKCKPFLTEAQVSAVDKAMDDKLKSLRPADGAAPTSAVQSEPNAAPPPPPGQAPPPRTRGPAPKGGSGSGGGPKNGKTGDPCEGGE